MPKKLTSAKISADKKQKVQKKTAPQKEIEFEQPAKAEEPQPAPAEKLKASGGKSNKALLIVVIIALAIFLIICTVSAYFIYGAIADDDEPANANTTITNINKVNENQNENADVSNENTNTTNQNTNSGVTESRINPVLPDKSETTYSASSTLKDETDIGFDYSASKVADTDFSTAWTEDATGGGVGEWVKITFATTAKLNRLGIVPGYCRAQDIYDANNRVKTLELEFSDGTTVEKTLTDSYQMHMIDFDTIETDYIKVTIKDTHKGSLYDDTCVSELDIWSEWVINDDPTVAMNYYVKYKKDSALYPPSHYLGTPKIHGLDNVEVSSYSAYDSYFHSTMTLSSDVPDDSTFICKWLFAGEVINSQSIAYDNGDTTLNCYLYPENAPLHVKPEIELGGNWALGSYQVYWYMNGVFGTSKTFKISPQ